MVKISDLKISVIIAIYNTENFLPQCLNSVINQTHKNLEIILVNDGSTDNCPNICDEFAQKDNRIKYISQQNKGVSAARNNGLKICTGDYIYFADSDDFLEPNMLEILISKAVNNNAEVAACKWQTEHNNSVTKVNNNLESEQEILYNSNKALISLFSFETFIGFGWNKLFKRELLINNNIIFNESLHMLEDELFCCQAIAYANLVVYVPHKLYHYRINDASATHQTKFQPKMLERVTAINFIENVAKQTGSKPVLRSFKCRRMLNDIETLKYLSDFNEWQSNEINVCTKRIRKNIFNYLFFGSNYGGIKYKLAALVITVSPKLFFKISNKR